MVGGKDIVDSLSATQPKHSQEKTRCKQQIKRSNDHTTVSCTTARKHVSNTCSHSQTRPPNPNTHLPTYIQVKRATCKRSTSEPNSNCSAAKAAIALKTTPATTRSVRGECAVQKSACCEAFNKHCSSASTRLKKRKNNKKKKL